MQYWRPRSARWLQMRSGTGPLPVRKRQTRAGDPPRPGVSVGHRRRVSPGFYGHVMFISGVMSSRHGGRFSTHLFPGTVAAPARRHSHRRRRHRHRSQGNRGRPHCGHPRPRTTRREAAIPSAAGGDALSSVCHTSHRSERGPRSRAAHTCARCRSARRRASYPSRRGTCARSKSWTRRP